MYIQRQFLSLKDLKNNEKIINVEARIDLKIL